MEKLRNLIRFWREIRQPDPRDERIQSLIAETREEMSEIMEGGRIGSVLCRLNKPESDLFWPGTPDAPPIRVFISGTNSVFALDWIRGDSRIKFNLYSDNTTLLTGINIHTYPYRDEYHRGVRLRNLYRSRADKVAKQLQSIEFAHRTVNILTQIKREFPQSFQYDLF